LRSPNGIACDSKGWIYGTLSSITPMQSNIDVKYLSMLLCTIVCDAGTQRVRKFRPGSKLVTVAGKPDPTATFRAGLGDYTVNLSHPYHRIGGHL
jgi:hypothetical protein